MASTACSVLVRAFVSLRVAWFWLHYRTGMIDEILGWVWRYSIGSRYRGCLSSSLILTVKAWKTHSIPKGFAEEVSDLDQFLSSQFGNIKVTISTSSNLVLTIQGNKDGKGRISRIKMESVKALVTALKRSNLYSLLPKIAFPSSLSTRPLPLPITLITSTVSPSSLLCHHVCSAPSP